MFYFQNLNIFNLKMSKLITIRNKNILGVTKGHIFCFIYKYLNAEEFRSISVSVCLATSCNPMWSEGAFDPPSICPPVCLFGIQTVLVITPVWDLIETWGFCEDIKNVKGIGLMMMTTMRRTTTRWRTMTRTITITRTTTLTRVSQLWD